MPDENWTKIMSKDVDIPAFLRNIDHVKAGWTMACPFCGGTVRMVANADGKNEYACDSCDMRIETDAN